LGSFPRRGASRAGSIRRGRRRNPLVPYSSSRQSPIVRHSIKLLSVSINNFLSPGSSNPHGHSIPIPTPIPTTLPVPWVAAHDARAYLRSAPAVILQDVPDCGGVTPDPHIAFFRQHRGDIQPLQLIHLCVPFFFVLPPSSMMQRSDLVYRHPATRAITSAPTPPIPASLTRHSRNQKVSLIAAVICLPYAA